MAAEMVVSLKMSPHALAPRLAIKMMLDEVALGDALEQGVGVLNWPWAGIRARRWRKSMKELV